MRPLTIFMMAATAVLLVCAAGNAWTQSTATNNGSTSNSALQAEKNEVRDFPLTTAKLSQYEAAGKAYRALMTKDLKLAQQLDAEITRAGVKTISGAVKIMETHPPIVSSIGGCGLNAHDYVVMTYTLMDASGAVAAKKKGSKDDFSGAVLPSNMAFVEKHYEKVTKVLGNISGPSKDKDDDDDD
jgi:hypothetical protein